MGNKSPGPCESALLGSPGRILCCLQRQRSPSPWPWRWPVYQSEMKISVRCQGNANGGRRPGSWVRDWLGPAIPSFPVLQHKSLGDLATLIRGQQANVRSLIECFSWRGCRAFQTASLPFPHPSIHPFNWRKGKCLFETLAHPFPISGRKESLIPRVPRSGSTMRTGIIILWP